MYRPLCAAALAALLAATLASTPARAFKIDPWSYRPPGVSPARIESQIEHFFHNPRMLLLRPLALGSRVPAAMGQLKEAVHENLTELSIRCMRLPLARGTLLVDTHEASGMITRCAGRDGPLHSHAPDLGAETEELIRAVRFNDAPPVKTAIALMALVTPSALVCGEVRVPENAVCWGLLMAHAASLAATDPANSQFSRHGNVLYRSHFGDMQFMHAMSARGDTLARAHERVMLWSQFTYQVASEEISPGTRIGALPAFASILDGFEDVSVSAFFEIRGNAPPAAVRRLAQGALLHTIQDSFAEGHAERMPAGGTEAPPGAELFGPITAMRDFTCQSEEKHSEADRAGHYAWFRAAVHEEKSPVTIGAQVLDLIARRVKWDAPVGRPAPGGGAQGAAPSVAHYLRHTVFPIEPANAALLASAGAQFVRTKAPAAAAFDASTTHNTASGCH